MSTIRARALLAAVLGAVALGTAGCPAIGPTGPTTPAPVQATCDEPAAWCGAAGTVQR